MVAFAAEMQAMGCAVAAAEREQIDERFLENS
jgi:hypothetical protein